MENKRDACIYKSAGTEYSVNFCG